MLKTIFVDGDKGGVGKSLVARALVDMFLFGGPVVGLHQPPKVVVFDADRSNPDVCGDGGFEVQGNITATHLTNLETDVGWSEFGDKMDQYVSLGAQTDIRVVVSMPAQIGPKAFDGSIPLVGEIMREVNAVPVWVMSRTQDCINALEFRRKTMTERYASGVVVKNLFFGAGDKFNLWKESDLRSQIIEHGEWAEVEFPEFNDVLLHAIGRKPFQDAIENGTSSGNPLGMGSRLSLQTWRHAVWQALSMVEIVGVGEG